MKGFRDPVESSARTTENTTRLNKILADYGFLSSKGGAGGAPESSSESASPVKRPTGVTILAVLAILGGIGGLLGGAALLVLSSLAAAFVPEEIAPFQPLVTVAGVVFLVIGIVSFFLAYGFLKGRGWAWTIGIIVNIISIISNVGTGTLGPNLATGVASSAFGIIIAIIIIVYLTRPHVKTFFGKAPTS